MEKIKFCVIWEVLDEFRFNIEFLIKDYKTDNTNHSKQCEADCGFFLHLGSLESHETLKKKFILQLGTLNPQGIHGYFSFH